MQIFGTTVCTIDNNYTSITIDETPLTKHILGYTNRFNATSSLTLTANSPINLNAIDTCLYLQFPNLPNMNNSNGFTGFKLPINNVGNNKILLINDSVEHQSIIFNNSTFI